MDITKLKTILPALVKEINSFIPINQTPSFIFLDTIETKKIVNRLNLNKKMRAFTHKSIIVFLSGMDYSNLENILRHELFHVGINQHQNSLAVIPDWFNESIAYYLCNDVTYALKSLLKELDIHYSDIKNHLISDTILKSNLENRYNIIKSFGLYFCTKYNNTVIKDLLLSAIKYKSIEHAFIEKLNCTISTLIDNWYEAIKEKDYE